MLSNQKIRIKFCLFGSLTNSFDFSLIPSISKYLAEFYPTISIYICGDGPLYNSLSQKFASFPNIHLPGYIDRDTYRSHLSSSLLFYAPYINRKDFQLSIPNKIYDAISYGVPILTTLDGSLSKFILSNGIGFFSEFDRVTHLHYLHLLLSNKDLLSDYSSNCIALNHTLTFEQTYLKFAQSIVNTYA